MASEKFFENYPAQTILISNLVSAAIYVAGAFIIYQIGAIWAALYLALVAYIELRLMKCHCVNCHYHGKLCAFGKGKISSLFFKKGDPKKFIKAKISWKDIAPDFMVAILPAAIGAILLMRAFSPLILSLTALLLVLCFLGNAFVRGSLACKYCRQREIGCPAQRLFDKKKK